MAGSHSRVALLLFFVFAAGAAAGVAADRLALLPDPARADETAARDDDHGERRRRSTTIERFADDLALTTRQRSEIEEILGEFRSDVKAMRAEFEPRWHALIDTARTRIEAQLTEEQVEQYRALLEQRRERRRGDDRKRDGPDGERDDGKRERDLDTGGETDREEGGR